MLFPLAWADAGATTGPSALEQLVPFIFVIVIFYFLLIRPQAKKARTHQTFLQAMQRGDQVLTTGGILGTIEGLTEQFVTLEIANGVRVRILRSQIASPAQSAEDKK
jgi:preprotein translocase subunit YajC